MLCPNCASELWKNPSHAHLVWQCKPCGGVYGIIVIDKPHNKAIQAELPPSEAATVMELSMMNTAGQIVKNHPQSS